jgi:hypothetical protein
LKFLGRV